MLLESLKSSDSREKVLTLLAPDLRKGYADSLANVVERSQLEYAEVLYKRITNHAGPSKNFLRSEALVVLQYKLKDFEKNGVTISKWTKEGPDGAWLCSDLGIPGSISQ